MTNSAKTLMQIESEKRRKVKRLLSTVAGLPVLGIGISLIYYGYSETDYLYLFLYFAMGLILSLFGFMLMISGVPTAGKKIIVGKSDGVEVEIKSQSKKCPYCDSDVISAGKFCGNCGQPL